MKQLLLTILVLLLSIPSLSAQDKKEIKWWPPFQKKIETQKKPETKKKFETKKDITKQRDYLNFLVDSLRNELESRNESIQLSDTLSMDDTLSLAVGEGDSLIIIDQDDMPDMALPNTDSLLSIWYLQRNLTLIENEEMDLDSTFLVSNIPDSIYLTRLQKMNSFISLPYNNIVRNHIIYYTEKIPNKSEVFLGLANYYMPIFEDIFSQYNLPVELKAMAIIESWLNPKAVSRVQARGMWQFMFSTARRYNLLINSYVDERYDPIASAHAAAKYLRDSYIIFSDWSLAIASYNCGIGNVNKAIRRSGGSRDFWEIYPYLPRETRGYVPSFIAALYTLNFYKEHQLTPKPITLPAHVDTIKVNKMLHFEQVSHFTGITVEELRNLNPQYLHDIVPGVEREYILQIPYDYTNKFIDNEKEIYTYKDSIYFNPSVLKKIKETAVTSSNRIVHKVKSGETLSHLALRYRVKTSDIKRWNNIGNTIRIGQKIVIYTAGGPAPKSTSKSKTTSSTPKTTISDGYVIYTVKDGDNLWDISKKFSGVSVNDILEINGMNSTSKIYPGMKIKIKKSN